MTPALWCLALVASNLATANVVWYWAEGRALCRMRRELANVRRDAFGRIDAAHDACKRGYRSAVEVLAPGMRLPWDSEDKEMTDDRPN